MRWPWQSAPVEHRSSIADQVVTAILQSASGGGGVRPALATAALESAASLYASALAACEVRGPSSVTRAIDASWRASVAASLIRRGQALFTIGADPASGLTLTPASSWDVHGGPWPASWYYRVQLAGPSGTAWETHTAASLLHLRWQVDPARPWAGVSPLQRARDTTRTPTTTWTATTRTIRSPNCGRTSARRAVKCSRLNRRSRKRTVRRPHRARIIKPYASARIHPATWSSCGASCVKTSRRRARFRAGYSTRVSAGKRRAKRGGSASRHRWTDSHGGSKRSYSYS